MKAHVDELTSSSKRLNVKSSLEFDAPPNLPNPYSPNYQQQIEDNRPPPNYINIYDSLPSRLIFNEDIDLYIRPFTADEVILLNYADLSDSSRPIAQAIDSVLYSKHNSCLDLTYSDVKAILCWLRVNSFIKNRFTVKGNCKQEKHYAMISSGESTVESLISELPVIHTDFYTDYVDVELARSIREEVFNSHGIELVPLTFKMQIEVQELFEELIPLNESGERDENLASPENLNLLWIASFAKYFHQGHGNTLKEKIDFFRFAGLHADIFSDIKRFQKATYHNIKEQVTHTCKECGGEIVTNLSIKPRNFFS